MCSLEFQAQLAVSFKASTTSIFIFTSSQNKTNAAITIPQNDMGYDWLGHIPAFEDKQHRCGYAAKDISLCNEYSAKLFCIICDRNCLLKFHADF